MKQEFKSTKITKETWQKIQMIKAYTGESILKILERLVFDEFERVKKKDKDNIITMPA